MYAFRCSGGKQTLLSCICGGTAMNQKRSVGAKSHDSGGVGREYYPCRFGKTNDMRRRRRVAGNSLGWWNASWMRGKGKNQMGW